MDSLTFTGSKRERDEEGLGDSPEAKRFRTDILLHIFDDDSREDDAVEGELDSVMRSLEAEIGLSPSCPDRHAVSGQPELGFLLEASDDELGLPPTAEEEPPLEASGFWGFEDEISNGYDAFDLAFGGAGDDVTGEDGVVVFDGGLFGDFGDVALLPPSDLWRPEGLPAV